MARFCGNCGAPAANDEMKFCVKCGTVFPAAGPPARTAPQPAATPAAAQSSGPWVKVLLGVLGFFVLMVVLVVATLAYIGYRVKKRAERIAESARTGNIVSLGQALGGTPSGGGPSPGATQGRDVCSLLSKEEASAITGVTITEAHGSTSECTYASATNPKVVVNGVTWQGGSEGFKMTVFTMKFGAAGTPVVTKVPGIGDEAYAMMPFQGKDKESFQRDLKQDNTGMLKGMSNLIGQFPLVFLKGDVMVSVSVSESRDPDEAKKAIAAKIAPRI